MRTKIVLGFFLFLPAAAWSQWSGHIKYQMGQFWFEDNNIASQLGYAHPNAHNVDYRLNYKGSKGNWQYALHYQAQSTAGQQHRLQQDIQSLVPNLSFDAFMDDSRLLNLSDDLLSERDVAIQHRLDRLWLSYSQEKWVVKFGRQAISWGNGQVFQPLDVIAPFAPATVNTDYKMGDDMLYGQWLFASGADAQFLYLPRRSLAPMDNDEIKMKASSLAVKYRSVFKFLNYDLLLARHYDDLLIGLGVQRSLGEAQWRLDLSNSRNDAGENVVTAMTNLDYSWVWWQRNFYGFMEYYFNELGEQRPSLAKLSPQLAERLARSEVFTYGRHYLAVGLNIELHALFRVTPSVIANLGDQSSQLLLRGQYDWKQNLIINGGVNLSLGSQDTEFGGLPIPGMGNTIFSSGQWIYLQLSYFY